MTTIGLPKGYTLLREIDLEKDKKLNLRVNLISLGITLFVLLYSLVIWLLFLRQEALFSPFVLLIGVALGTFAYLVLHEAVHGLFIYLFSGVKPSFGFHGGFAWAGLKEGYFDKKSYLVIALSPVIFWGLVLAVLSVCVPAGYPLWRILQAVNLGGAAGDYYVSCLLFHLPQDILCNDTGTSMRFYEKEKK